MVRVMRFIPGLLDYWPKGKCVSVYERGHGNSQGSFPGDAKNGRMTRYLLKEEMLATSFSIEGRYPLLAMRPFLVIYKIMMTPTVSISRTH